MTVHARGVQLLMAFAQFEERVKEIERSRAIYKFALDSIPKSKAGELYQVYAGSLATLACEAGLERPVRTAC